MTATPVMSVTIRRWIDLLDRTLWTFVQAFAAAMIVLGFNDWKQSLGAAAIAGAIAALKALAAQQLGTSQIGDAVPGASVVEVARAPGYAPTAQAREA